MTTAQLAVMGRTAPRAVRTSAPARRASFDLPERLFVVASFLAPLSMFVVKSLTVFDLMIVMIGCLIVAGPHRLQPLPRPIAITGWVFLLAALVSSFRATVPVEALTQTAQFAFAWFWLLPVVLTMATSMRVLTWSLFMFLAGSFGSVVAAIVVPAAQGADRFLIFYSDNPNRLGYPGAYLLPFAIFFLVKGWQAGHRLLAVIAGASLAYVVLWALGASGSRGAAVGLIVGVTVYFLLRPDVGIGISAARLLVTVGVNAAVLLLLTRSGLFPLTFGDRLTRTFDPEERSALVDDRASLAVAGLRAFRDSPLIGTGLDNFRYVAQRYAEGTTMQAPHNLWIQFLAQVGIVGTVAFACFIVYWFSALIAAHRRALDPASRRLTWAFVASMAAVMSIFMTTPVLSDRHYWLILGLGMALAALPRRHPYVDSGGAP